ncbi:probable chitinase 10 [Drosophila grimshawi]|uniref:GH15116 n=1 Tax=Drosophila grimshawi TaxID=7222 RepID=B4IYQ2_DROGR|nr:probable chitinase 10 [Drosophila grimshawi]EDV96589.1 GH15116 [Drosophila grimshawi]
MEIRMHFALVVGICLGVAHAAEDPIHKEIINLSHICKDRTEGQLVPNPLDCSAYFACGSVPKLFYCNQGLNFDAVKLMCDVPEKAQCIANESNSPDTTSKLNGYLNADIGSKPHTDFDWWMTKPKPDFVAIDVETGLAVNPMDKYDPELIDCRHFGAYFLPHPSNCQLYFICAYGHLHRHHCGRGTLWNYRRFECQPSGNAECYSKNNLEYVEGEKAQSTTPGQVTVCYIVDTSSALPTTSLIPPTPTSAPHSSAISVLKCPSDQQSYLSHPDDCSKYYICIAGMPVLTSCPRGLYWDQKSGYCDQAKNVKCFKNT